MQLHLLEATLKMIFYPSNIPPLEPPRPSEVCPDGHDGLATPYELRPSLHWLKSAHAAGETATGCPDQPP